MLERSDRLLRGSRDERIAAILALDQAEWGLDAVLDLHRGLLDHAGAVRLAAVEALKAIAQRSPEQLTLTPASFLAHHMFSFTVASGAAEGIFGFLVELGTPEAIRLAMEALEHASRNDDFKVFVETVVRAKRLDLLRQFPQERLGRTKWDILRMAIGGWRI